MGVFTPQSTPRKDALASALSHITFGSFVVAVAALPLLFIPVVTVPLVGGKLLVFTLLLAITFVVGALFLLRLGSFEVPASATISAGWLIVAAALVSAGLSGDLTDSIRISSAEQYSAGVLTICFVALTVAAILSRQTKVVSWVLKGLLLSTSVLVVWHALRLLFGTDLSFGLFASPTTTPIGNWSDLSIIATALIFGLLVVVANTRLQTWMNLVLLLPLVASLFILFVVSNSVLWVLLGVISLTIIIMTIMRRQQETTPSLLHDASSSSMTLVGFAGLIFIATLVVVFGGSTMQSSLNERTNTSFVEVRPAVGASLDIVRQVWSSDALTGVGPARYADAWRTHKADALNQTIFWDTNFNTGHSFLMTQAVENGLLGITAWILFFVLLIVSGVRTFVVNGASHKDSTYTLAVTTYVLAIFLWSTTLFLTPGLTIVLLATLLTGTYVGLSFMLRPRRLFMVSLLSNQKLGFVIVAVLVVLIIAVVWLLQQMVQQTSAIAVRNSALTTPDLSVEQISARLEQSYARMADDDTARLSAQLQLAQVQRLFSVTEPTQAQQQTFQQASVAAANASAAAITLDPTNPANWYTQLQVYAVLAQAGVEGASERARAALDTVRDLDPKSPQPDYLSAQLAVIDNDAAGAREAATAAIQKKRNYTPALLLLAQIEIGDGNVEEALRVTESVLSFEPENAARWYQLGVLYRANSQPAEALLAFNEAINRDAEYANALYLRGVTLAEQGETEAALTDLEQVLALNPGNEQVEQLLAAIEAGPGEAEAAVASSSVETISNDDVGERNPESVSEAAAATDLVTTTTDAPSVEGDTDSQAAE